MSVSSDAPGGSHTRPFLRRCRIHRREHNLLIDIGKISCLSDPTRITGPLLDVLELLLQAACEGQELHGWAIMKGSSRSGPTVYGVLDRLEDASKAAALGAVSWAKGALV